MFGGMFIISYFCRRNKATDYEVPYRNAKL